MKQRNRRLLSAAAALTMVFSAAGTVIPQQQTAPKALAAGGLLAFPGAVGGGKYATGGRGGEVYHVTNLNDSGTGSFRDAVSKSNRIVVFDVSGTIELKSNVVCQSNVTIAGQTAPGGSGITLKNYKFGMGGDNIIARFISSRPGPYNATSSGNDAWGGAAGGNSIIDHCSIGWSSDEQWGLYSKNDNYTCQYTVIGPANSWGGHDKGIHGFGIMFGRANFSFDHCLIIHNVSRNFRGKVTDRNAADFTNNIIYDWGYQTTYGTIGHINYVNNTLKRGTSTVSGIHYASVSDNDNFMLYLTGNRILNKDNSVANAENNNWSAVGYNGNKSQSTTESASHFPITVNGEDVSTVLTAESASASYDHVISFAGNGISPEKRTAIDRQCANETKNGTGTCSGTAAYDSSVSDLNKYSIQCGVTYNYPAAVTQKEITDADNDGMDDAWELVRGLNPNDPTDYKGDYAGLGYMNIEYYINDLTVDAFPAGVVERSPENGVDPISAFDTIEAEDYASMTGVIAEDNASCSGGKNIGYVESGDSMMFRKVDFENGARSFTAKVSGNVSGIELYLDSMSGTPAASVKFAGTSGFSDYREFTWSIPAITGEHNLYLKFTGGEGYLLNLDWFTFGKDAVAVNGRLFSDLFIADNAYPGAWAVRDGAQVGNTFFGDRDATFTTLPAELTGAEQILTACDAKNTFADLATLKAAANCKLYILLDERVETAGNTPDWLGSFTKEPITAQTSNDVTFLVYSKVLSAGDAVTLGSNNMSGSCVNYTVLLQESAQETETTTTTTVTAPPDEILYGDADCSGEVDVLDAVLMARVAAEDTETGITEQGKRNGDVTGDGMIGRTDMSKLLKYLAGLISTEQLKP